MSWCRIRKAGLPGFGEFLLVELTATEALVGRVSRYHAAGQLATDRGDAYLGDLAKMEDAVPAPLMRQMLRYNLKMQLLGHLQSASRSSTNSNSPWASAPSPRWAARCGFRRTSALGVSVQRRPGR